MVWLFGFSSAACFLAALGSLWVPKRTVATKAFSWGMLLFGCEQLLAALALRAESPDARVKLLAAKILLDACVSSVWLTFSIVYSRGNYREFVARWKWILAGIPFVSLAIWATSYGSLIVGFESDAQRGDPLARLGRSATLIQVVVLLGYVSALAQLEKTFRYAVGALRWKIKWILLGFGLIFLMRIYSGSQTILYSSWNASIESVNAASNLIAGSLIAISTFRARTFSVELYPSRVLLHRSMITLMVAAYLVIIGVFTRWIGVGGAPGLVAVRSLAVLVAVALLGTLLLSDRFQKFTQNIISRHFLRPVYDHQALWGAFVAKLSVVVDEAELCRKAAGLLSDTFRAQSVNIWLKSPHQDRHVLRASTVFQDIGSPNLKRIEERFGELVELLGKSSEPMAYRPGRGQPLDELFIQCDPAFFNRGGHQVWASLRHGGEWLGVIGIADRGSGVGFSVEEQTLLQTMAQQIAGSLKNIRLSEEIQQAREMEAFQTMSTFFIHDLKNVASSMSMMMQNMSVHFDDPEFREDAKKVIHRAVDRIKKLIERLGMLRRSQGLRLQRVDLNEIARSVVGDFKEPPSVRIRMTLGESASLMLDRTEMEKVLTNLVVNAIEALEGGGEVAIRTWSADTRAGFCVEDDGVGMTPDFVANDLFRPFQTTKKDGTGIGMYHCRRIVEIHRGRIDIESEPEKGTRVVVSLPRKEAKE